ncbi:MAG: glycosyltransferase [Proteobacteria bacterium]|nr:glycosyltransferase [Pseudomonadota bacterium]
MVIPLYNHEKYIQQAIDSVFAQSSSVRELIIVDDGSKDSSPDIAAKCAQADSRVIFWSQANQGAHAAINAGIARATSEYIAILNSDDAYHEGRIEKMVSVLEQKQSLDLVASGLMFSDESGRSIKNDWYKGVDRYRRNSKFLDLALINGNFIMTTSNFVMRRKVVQEVGGFAPLRYAHDLEFLLRLLARGKSIEVIDDQLLTYRLHPTNTIKEGAAKVKVEWALVIANYIEQMGATGKCSNSEWMIELMNIMGTHALHPPVLAAVLGFRDSNNLNVERNNLLADESFRQSVAAVIS